jgi:hypothetical protein
LIADDSRNELDMALATIIVALMALILGMAFCFGGYKWFPILLPIWGLLTGFFIGAAGVSSIYEKSLLSIIIIIVAGSIAGILLAVAVYLFYNLAIILLAATFGYFIGETITIYLGFNPGLIPIVIGLISAAILGFVAIRLNLPKYIIILFTSLIGSIAILGGTLLLTGQVTLESMRYGILGYIVDNVSTLGLLAIILAAFGLIVQLRDSRNFELDLTTKKKAA